MMKYNITDILYSFKILKKYSESERFMGWDPYDGLNSKLFQSIPFLKKSALCRLVVIQGFKRLPINLRKIALVPKQYNAKGIGLFLQGYCNLYNLTLNNPSLESTLGTKNELLSTINQLSVLLISLQSKGYSGACWGYNFDWQARRLFLFPKYTPTIVATTFCASALISAYEVTRNREYLDTALSSADFILKDLNRKELKEGFLFSYSPLEGNNTVINASLLGSKMLSLCYKYTKNEEYKKTAELSVKACCHLQSNDGSWVYGLLPIQSWKDSFHTGYNLDALIAYEQNTGDFSYHSYIERGFNYYITNFFKDSGVPKYYHNKIYPIDIHCPGQLLVTLFQMNKIDEYKELTDKVLTWTINNMQDKKGYFYYQFKKSISSKISYMRWSNAFMFNALSYYFLGLNSIK